MNCMKALVFLLLIACESPLQATKDCEKKNSSKQLSRLYEKKKVIFSSDTLTNQEIPTNNNGPLKTQIPARKSNVYYYIESDDKEGDIGYCHPCNDVLTWIIACICC